MQKEPNKFTLRDLGNRFTHICSGSIPASVRSKAQVYSRFIPRTNNNNNNNNNIYYNWVVTRWQWLFYMSTRGFESQWRHGCSILVIVVCFVSSATKLCLFQRSLTRVLNLYEIQKSQKWGGLGSSRAVTPQKKSLLPNHIYISSLLSRCKSSWCFYNPN